MPALAGMSYGYGSLMERHLEEVTHPRTFAHLGPYAPKSVKIALLSDFHFDPLNEAEFFARCVERTNRHKPDIVLLLGDFVSHSARSFPQLTAELGKLSAPGGVYAVLGNHDMWVDDHAVQRSLERVGIPVMRNHCKRIALKDGEVVLAGLESVWGGGPDPECWKVRRGEQLLLAMHEPDYIDHLPKQQRRQVAIQMSGHTHGGQICAPFGTVIQRVSWGERYTRGLYDLDDTQIYVTRGVGTMGIHARLFCRPEITMLTVFNRTLV